MPCREGVDALLLEAPLRPSYPLAHGVLLGVQDLSDFVFRP